MDYEKFKKQLEVLLKVFADLEKKSRHSDLSDLPTNVRQNLVTRSIAAIQRITGASSAYSKDIERLISTRKGLHQHISPIMGVVQALRDDIHAGYLESLVELAHADVFSTFLEMAQHLSESKYKDAAAVIAGSTLESHLRELCNKNGIDVEGVDGKGNLRPKKADRLNADLAGAAFYSKLDQKSVTAWLDLRNKAAHGKYDEYSAEQVALLISGLQDFLVRNPA